MRAALAALMASTSWGFSWSAPRTVMTTWVSLRYPSAKLGRSGRSMSRAVRMAVSDGRPSRRKNEPGDLAGGVHALFDVDGEREEVDPLPDARGGVGRGQHDGVAELGDHRALGLLGEAAGLERQGLARPAARGPETLVGLGNWRPCGPLLSGARESRAAERRWGQFPVGDPRTGAPGTWPGDPRLAADLRSPLVNLLCSGAADRSAAPEAIERPGGPLVGLHLAAQPQPGDQLPVALDIVVSHVVEEPPPAADHLHQPSRV